MLYEGSANYETHVVSLWIANDEELYNSWTRIAGRMATVDKLANLLKKVFERDMPVLDGVWFDLLKAGFDEVDWLDVARGIIEK